MTEADGEVDGEQNQQIERAGEEAVGGGGDGS